jgi:hypothetical protein
MFCLDCISSIAYTREDGAGPRDWNAWQKPGECETHLILVHSKAFVASSCVSYWTKPKFLRMCTRTSFPYGSKWRSRSRARVLMGSKFTTNSVLVGLCLVMLLRASSRRRTAPSPCCKMATPTGLLSWPPPNNHHSQSISTSPLPTIWRPNYNQICFHCARNSSVKLGRGNNIKHWCSWQTLEAANEGHKTKKTTGDWTDSWLAMTSCQHCPITAPALTLGEMIL